VVKRALGAVHADTLAAERELARWTGEAGDAAAAQDRLAALLPVVKRALGDEHPDTLTTRQELARWSSKATGHAGTG
jgi:hypothetical protein